MKTRVKMILKNVVSAVIIVCIISQSVVTAFATQNRTGNFSKSYSLSGNGATDIVRVAAAQLGRTGSQLGYSEQWCADFVSDCAILANQSAAIPAAGYCPTLRQNIINAGGQYVSKADAKAGDIVFYGNNGADHVEIVYAASNGNVSTYGGNSGSEGSLYSRKVKQHATQTMSIAYIVRPNYSGSTSSGCNCSTSYAGTYTVNTSQYPLTMRSGHGTGYSAVTTIPKGTEVTVTKGDGTWAHVEWNGYSGYCAMEYLEKKETDREIEARVWISDDKMGTVPSEFYTGNRYYLCYEIRYKDTKERIGYAKNYTVTEQFTLPNGQTTDTCTYNNDNNWYSIVCTSEGHYKGTVTFSGDLNGRMVAEFDVKVKDDEKPVIKNVRVSDVSSTGYTVSCEVTDNMGVDRVQFPTWTVKNDQDDIQSNWVSSPAASGTRSGNTYTYRVNISDHNNERGQYLTHIYAYDKNGNVAADGSVKVNVPEPTEPTTEKPTQKPTEPATEKPTQKPTEPATEKPTQKPTEPATEKPTQKPTEPATEKPTQKPTEPATEKPTQKPTEPATEKPTQKPTEPATEEPATEQPTETKRYIVKFMDDDKIVDTQLVSEGKSATEPKLNKTGYTLYWDDEFDEVYENMIINAEWVANDYRVKFNAAGGRVYERSMEVTYDEEYGELPEPERSGYLFDGWYTKKSGGEEISEFTVMNTAKTHTLYAHWEKVTVPKISIRYLSSLKKGMSVAMNAGKGEDGCQIMYSTSKNFRSYKKINTSDDVENIKKLKSRTKYYVKVRGYVYDSKGKKVYGAWSKVNTIAVK